MTRLSDTQTILLSTASARSDRSILPVPETVSAGGRALDRTPGSLLKRGLVAESTVHHEAASWRRGEDDEFRAAVRHPGFARTDRTPRHTAVRCHQQRGDPPSTRSTSVATVLSPRRSWC